MKEGDTTAPGPLANGNGLTLNRADFEAAYRNVAPYVYRTPMLTSRSLSEECGLDVRLKAELFQRGGSYKLRGPLNKIARLSEEERARGVICSSAGNHSQGVALAARQYGVRAVVVMAENATRSKIAATEGYGARVVLHGSIWDEANEKALELVEAEGLTYIHPFDDPELIAGQGTLGLEIMDQLPETELLIVPIGGGGLISGVSMAAKSVNPEVRIIGVESSGAPGMKRSVEAGASVVLDEVDCHVDGLRVRKVGNHTCSVVSRFVDEIVTLPDSQIFDAMLWLMTRAKVVVEGAAAAPVGALLQGLVDAPAGTRTVCVLSGGNLDVEGMRGRSWN
ncbi:MAG: pyridoxal-phosphate dependent enzyme [Gammaproteobacteria bacterium]|nr:pyridoxal-phosphate dependent enzyme [Gammaproteobacteria bacterium]MYF61084.1 pyridoxal-phosphate dependent enzyme [Gammaproteobacteria bacterium]MYI22549.1 pyridoxal-phosphate dependent enzyme [Gammaproteobacteria bacterium]